jgi:probable F420-dependent oxidoreductase
MPATPNGGTRAFRFGLLVTQRSNRTEWADLAKQTESLGFSTLVVPDHFDDQLAPIPALMAAADATTNLRVGTLVLNNDFRHPLALAKEAATLDLLSDGRLELGLGAGFRQAEYLPTGIRFDESAVRVDRFEEAVHIIKAAFRAQPVTFSGKHYRVSDYRSFPATEQALLPLMIGGGGARILRLAGREANIVGIAANLGAAQPDVGRDYVSDRIEQKINWVKEGARDRFASLELQTLVPLVIASNDRRGALAQAADRLGLTSEQADDALLLLVGSVNEMADRLVARRERFGISYVVFYADSMEAVAPIVARLAGT